MATANSWELDLDSQSFQHLPNCMSRCISYLTDILIELCTFISSDNQADQFVAMGYTMVFNGENFHHITPERTRKASMDDHGASGAVPNGLYNV